jgi:hypothetical protein
MNKLARTRCLGLVEVALRGVYFARFHTTSAVVPIDPAGLYHFSSSSESDVMIRLLSMPSKLGHELLSI